MALASKASSQATLTASMPSSAMAGENGHELAIAAGLGAQPILHLPQRRRQRPVLERRAVAQRPGLLLQRRHVVPGIEEGAITLETAHMLADDLALGHGHDPIGVGAQRHRLAGVAAIDAVAVAINVHE